MALVANLMTPLFDLLFLPFGWSVLTGITVWSVVMGVVFLKAYALATNQLAIKDVKRRMSAAVLEVRLFQQDIAVLLRAQGKLFGAVGGYTWQAGRSIVLLLPVALLLIAQFVIRWDVLPLTPNTTTEVSVRMGEDAPRASQAPSLSTSSGLEVTGDPFRVARTEFVYKIKTRRGGAHELTLTHGDEAITMPIYVGASDAPKRLYHRMTKNNFEDDFLYPGGPRFDAESHFDVVEVEYPHVESVLGVGNWGGLPAALWYFCIVSLISGFALKNKMGVEL
ncbi:MAG: hypothetical protein CME06_05705 [Gemmatimonadetes bacterium]|nr:hypothetical protein [Gemmatimonadota bacterium]